MSDDVKRNWLKWLGHVLRKDDGDGGHWRV